MDDLDRFDQRLSQIERKLDSILTRESLVGPASGHAAPKRRSNTSRVLWGIIVCVLGVIWLGQALDVQWLKSLEIMPLAVIAFGLYLIFGSRNR
ncbi:hypothetical protein KKH27_04215 [bacterium]|nr:hypothetical protein [bacterium]MBU1983490.1 hypothetical protein [bacterium]